MPCGPPSEIAVTVQASGRRPIDAFVARSAGRFRHWFDLMHGAPPSPLALYALCAYPGRTPLGPPCPVGDRLARCWDVPNPGTQIDPGRMVFFQGGVVTARLG